VVHGATLICAEAATTGRPCSICMRVASDVVRTFLREMPSGAFEVCDLDAAVRIAGSDA